MNYGRLLVMFVLLLAEPALAAPLDSPTADTLAEARRIVQEMGQDPRGPYSRIRWFCKDGSVLPPVAYACVERGGGRQHAEYSPKRQRLAELGWSVGTIFASLPFEEMFDSKKRQQRLRELPLERYLIDIDNGWVLKRARDYRGRVQLEDEEAAGKQLLLRLLSDTDWTRDNFLLVREAARAIPHGEDSDLARKVRRDAVRLAEVDRAADKWRAEIHSDPNAQTAKRLREWAGQQKPGELKKIANELANDLDSLYGSAGRSNRIASALKAIGTSESAKLFRTSIAEALDLAPAQRIAKTCSAQAAARSSYFAQLPAQHRLGLVDAMRELDAEVQLGFQELGQQKQLTRAETLTISFSLLECAFASGLISQSELASVALPSEISSKESVSLATYREAISRFKRTPGWAIGTIRHTFAEPLTRYSALDERAARFSDDLLRGSPMWMLGDTLKVLSKDVDHLSGSVVEIMGQSVGGAIALNSGVARGTLRIFKTVEALEQTVLNRTDIAVIPETIAELSPVAGILTLGEGNALSHVQLLARNFGIPNVAIDYDGVAVLEPLQGKKVLMIVTSRGDVLIEADEAPASTVSQASNEVVVPQPNLDRKDLLVLTDVRKEMSGRIVGPKAANLGELNRLFPGRVAPAIAIPFGVYSEHINAKGLTRRIQEAFAQRKEGTLDESAFDKELASVRSEIKAIELSPEVRKKLVPLMQEQFGEPGTYGVFVRSDTNVEDLPQFTGAGLNETLPNIVAFDKQLAGVSSVWSSILSPRALAWRSSVLANPDQIYASVLLMKSVPATKSGVLVTRNLYARDEPGLTVSTAWGVGGAVAGEAAETIVIKPRDAEVVSEAKSPYQRHLAVSGGVDMLPAPAGRVLTEDEIKQLRSLAAQVTKKYVPVLDEAGKPRPWDIEFGFVDGELTLFQIRPLVERGSGLADKLLRERRPNASKIVQGKTVVNIKHLLRD